LTPGSISRNGGSNSSGIGGQFAPEYTGENNINHFNLVYNIHKHEFGISKSDIYDLFLQKRFNRLIEVVNRDFVELFSKQRRELITRCLNYRYRRIIELIG